MAVNSFANIDYTIPGSGMTLLSTTTLSGATVTISSISQSYVNLFMIITGVTNATADGTFRIAPNNDSSISNFSGVNYSSAQGGLAVNPIKPTGNFNPSRTSAVNSYSVYINNYTSTTANKTWMAFYQMADTTPQAMGGINGGGILTTSAITSLVFSNSGGNLSTGTVLLYGVK
jgi:hypothetical protein